MIGPIGRVSWPLGEPRIRAATRLVEAHITQAFLVSLLFLLQGVKGRPSCPHKCKSSYLAVALWFHGNSRLLDFNLIWTYIPWAKSTLCYFIFLLLHLINFDT